MSKQKSILRTVVLCIAVVLIAMSLSIGLIACGETDGGGGSNGGNGGSGGGTSHTEHRFDEWRTEQPATCVGSGEKVRTCKECGFTERDSIAPTGVHKYSDWDVINHADCLNDGLRVRTCKECGQPDDDVIPATGKHSFSDWDTVEYATCGQDGLNIRYCNVCGFDEQKPIPASGNHSFDPWYTETPATCVRDGKQIRYCYVCGHDEQDVITATGIHTFNDWDWKIVREADCINEGLMTCKCTYCDEEDEDIIPANDRHTYGDWKTVTEATCGDEGSKVRYCDVCKHEDTGIIFPTYDHDYTWTLESKPHCNEGMAGFGIGYENGVCNTCGYETVKRTPAIEGYHEYGDWTIDTPATCQTEGWRSHICNKCELKTSERVDITSHNLDEYYQCTMCKDGLQYTYDEDSDGYTVTGRKSEVFEDIVAITVPSSYNGKPVTGIGYRGLYWLSFSEITIPATVTSIGEEAFYRCELLKRVNILGEGLKRIDKNAFYNCEKLEYINIPSSIESIDITAFVRSIYGKNIAIHISDLSTWFNLSITAEHDGYSLLGNTSLYVNENLVEEITVPDYVTTVSANLFRDCASLKSVVIPDHVVCIERYAFAYCDSLREITIGKRVTDMGDMAFGSNTSLESIYYNAVHCGDFTISPFMGSGVNIAFTVGNKVERIPNRLLTCENLGSSYFPSIASIIFEDDSVCALIGARALYGNSQLTSLIIPDCVTELGATAYDLESLTTLTIPAALIASAPNKDHLKTVIITSGEIGIKDETDRAATFIQNRSIRNVIIKDGVTSIGYEAFLMCTALTSITIADSVDFIGARAFYQCPITSIALPNNLTALSSQVFYECSSLETVTFPDSLTDIGASAFYGCSSLKSIRLDKLTSISQSAFNGCSSLSGTLIIPSNIDYISSSAFCDCKNITSVIILGDITVIEGGVFSGCTSLTSIVIPASVESIEGMAFGFTGNKTATPITRLYYMGTPESWSAIAFNGLGTAAQNEHIQSAPRYYYSEQQPTASGNYWHYVDGVPTVWIVEE